MILNIMIGTMVYSTRKTMKDAIVLADEIGGIVQSRKTGEVYYISENEL